MSVVLVEFVFRSTIIFLVPIIVAVSQALQHEIGLMYVAVHFLRYIG